MTIRTAVSSRSAARRHPLPLLLLAALLAAAWAPAALAHSEAESGDAAGDAVAKAMVGQFDRTADKLTQLAGAIPEDHYDWRPADEVRTVSEALMHTAEANFRLAAALGVDMPADMPEDMEGVTTKGEVAAWLETSIDAARGALEKASGGDMGAMVEAFGQQMPRATVAMIIIDHNAEHLGQLIAYGRANGVVPPWSRPRTAPSEAAAEGDGEGQDDGESR